MKKELISFENVSVKNSTSGKLSYANINIFEGEAIGIIGLKGAGIIRVLELLEGQAKVSSGIVKLRGERYQPNSVFEARKKGVYSVSFNCKLIKEMTISENFFLTRDKKNLFSIFHEESIKIETNNILNAFNMNMDADMVVGEINEVQCLFLEIIRAYLLSAKVIILKDVLREYKQNTINKFRKILQRLRKEGISVVFLGHNYKKILERLDRIYVLSEGSVARILYKGEYNERDLYSFMIGHHYLEKINMENAANRKYGNSIYEINGLTTKCIKNLSFSVKKGEIIGLLDYDYYCGNQLSRALIGEFPLEKGEIIINGEKIDKVTCNNIISKGVGLISHSTSSTLFNGLNIRDNVTISMLNKTHRSKKFVNDRVVKYAFNSIKSYLKNIEGTDQLNDLDHEDKIKIQLAKCMIADVKIIIVEHPILNADIIQGRMIHDFVQDMVKKGCAAIIISSSIEYLKNMSDYIIFIKNGEQVGSIASEEILGLYL